MNTKWVLLSSYLASKVPIKKQLLSNQDWLLFTALNPKCRVLKEREKKNKNPNPSHQKSFDAIKKNIVSNKYKSILKIVLLWSTDVGELDTLATIVFARRKGLICEALGPVWWAALEVISVDSEKSTATTWITLQRAWAWARPYFFTFLSLHRAHPSLLNRTSPQTQL